MSQQPAPEDSRGSGGRRNILVTRLVLLAVLAIAVVALIVDRAARQRAQAAYDDIQARLDREEHQAAAGSAGSAQDVISPAVVREITGREPLAIETSANRIVERYGWRGALRTYYVVATFHPGSVAYLVSVRLTDSTGAGNAERAPPAP